MKIFEFNKFFHNEEYCRRKFKEWRDKEEMAYQYCSSHDVVWLESKQQYQCKHYWHRTTLKNGTVKHGSKLPFMYWFIAMHLQTATKRFISAAELQRLLDYYCYQPIGELLHKLHSFMGKRNDKYTLNGCIELDEGFFSTEKQNEKRLEKLKACASSQRKSKVMVIAGSTPSENSLKKEQKAKSVNHITKMIDILNKKATTLDTVAVGNMEKESRLIIDNHKSSIHFKDIFAGHKSQVIAPKDTGKVLPWVHIAIANAKTLLADMYHGIKPESLLEYLHVFFGKFNHRYFGEDLLDHLVMIATS